MYKAQGITVVKAVLNIARKDFVVGLIYVGVLRAITLAGLMFEEPFDFSRFQNPPSKTKTIRLRDKTRRLPQIVPLPPI